MNTWASLALHNASLTYYENTVIYTNISSIMLHDVLGVHLLTIYMETPAGNNYDQFQCN